MVTAIEILSPANKRAGKGRQAYQDKRQETFASATNLVEIDLLRGGEAMPLLGEVPQSDYRILVYRRRYRPFAELYPFSVRDEIPKFLLPLRSPDVEPEVDLQSLMAGLYERAGFDSAVDYARLPSATIEGSGQTLGRWALARQGSAGIGKSGIGKSRIGPGL